MARISSYPRDLEVNDNDAWIGTESSNRLTRNFTASAVAAYLNLKGKVSVGGQMSFKWSNTQNGGSGTISLTGGGGEGDAFNTLTQLRISKKELSGQRVIEFLTYLVNKSVLIGQGDQISQFGHYTITSYTVDPADASYYIAALTFIGGNGAIAVEGTVYTVIHFNTSAGGGDVTLRQNFTAANQWVIANTTGKAEPSVTLIDTSDETIHGDITYTTATQITVDFNTAIAGSSILN